VVGATPLASWAQRGVSSDSSFSLDEPPLRDRAKRSATESNVLIQLKASLDPF
jgi:hypothetical protein